MPPDSRPEINAGRTPIELWYGARNNTLQPRADADSAGGGAAAQSAGLKIGIQGEPGSFSHQAAINLAPDAVIIPFSVSAEVFAAIDKGQIGAAAIPIENSLAGSVSEHFDLLLTHDVTVERETLLRIRHNLIAISGASIGEIDRVFSHPVALAQCRRFLAAHPRMASYAFYDTAGSVKQLVELGDRHAGAIASQAAADYYGAQILEANIEDNPENFTRFFLVRRSGEATIDPRANKISAAFSVENRSGSLVAALSALSRLGTNLTKIESRPVHGKPWEYIFYVDFQIHSPEEGTPALEALRPYCSMVKELGRYREADRPEDVGK